ncbi:hypothetical protein [Clostridium butyricum]|uniref:hypothetical protein n=1 Tax=Clostridium butyricum TaxID=1492 RepID=UPI0005C1E024|nr:hypothetical protein [Clostridium butyricum]MDU4852866.1 hypothetical protein [Clostridioides difficile]KIU07854.1 hypothetical protein SC08_Contig83orf01783 [Clostridium butyricum]MBA8967683.1 hypothetical protein [Clostridium butyricum]MBA8971249.1 hypothetical protein [Clostridium butyricum]MBC2427571.1 hypothetical protein [Clostridium butyricum]
MDNNKIESLLLQIIKNQESMQSDITEIKNKIDSIYDQTANLTKFRTKEDVFDIRDHLKIIK